LRFAGFVTTFNRPGQLSETLGSIWGQSRPPERLLVMDNGDADRTRTVLERFVSKPLEHRPLGANLGPAGAAAHALAELERSGFDWIAWGDDDTPPRNDDVFERLLDLAIGDEGIGGVGAVGARFDWRRGETRRLGDEELTGPVDVDVIGGGHQLILSARVIRTVGLPDARLFFGFEDPEYCLRIRRAGFRLVVDGGLMHSYREAAGRLAIKTTRRWLPSAKRSTLWRRYYVTRNYIHAMRKTFQRPDLARREATKALGRSLLAWSRGPRYGWSFARHQLLGVAHGYTEKLGRTIAPEPKVP